MLPYEVVEPQEVAARPKPPGEFLQIKSLLREKGYVKNEDIRRILGIARSQATRLLRDWVGAGLLTLHGKGRGARYVRKENASS